MSVKREEVHVGVILSVLTLSAASLVSVFQAINCHEMAADVQVRRILFSPLSNIATM